MCVRRRASTAPHARSFASLGVGLEGDDQRRADGRQPRVAGDREESAVEQVARDRAVRPQRQPGPHGGVERGEADQREARPAGERHRPQRGLGDDGERAFGADEQFREIDAARGQHAMKLIAAPVERRAGAGDRNPLGVFGQQLLDRGADGFGPLRRRTPDPGPLAHNVGVSRVPHDTQPGDVVAGVAVVERVAAAGVSGDHPADGAGRAAGRVRGEPATGLRQFRVQVAQHHARLHGHGVRADRQDAAEVNAQVENDRRAERFTGKAGASPPRDDRDVVAVTVADQGRDIVRVLRHGDGERFDLERAGVGGVQAAGQAVEVQPPAELAAEVVGDLLGVEHGRVFSVQCSVKTEYQTCRLAGASLSA